MNVARQAALKAGVPKESRAKRSIECAAPDCRRSFMPSNDADGLHRPRRCGGTESMSSAPYYLKGAHYQRAPFWQYGALDIDSVPPATPVARLHRFHRMNHRLQAGAAHSIDRFTGLPSARPP